MELVIKWMKNNRSNYNLFARGQKHLQYEKKEVVSTHIKKIPAKLKIQDTPLKMQLIGMFIFAFIIPVIIMGWVIDHKTYEGVDHSQKEMLSAYTQGIKGNIDITIASSHNTLKSLAAQSDLMVLLEDINSKGQLTEVVRLNNILLSLKNTVKSSNKLYETIFIADIHGNVIADGSQYKKEYMELNVKQTDYFARIHKGEKFIVGQPQRSISTDRILIPLVISVDSLSNHLGVLVIMFDLEKFTQPIHTIIPGKTGNAYILDQNGTVIYHTNKNKILSTVDATFLKNAVVKPMQEDKQDISQVQFDRFEEDEKKIVAYIQSEYAQWTVFVDMTKREYEQNVVGIRRFIGVTVAILVSISFIISLLYGKWIVHPITRLGILMEKVANGDLHVHAEGHTSGEIGVLNDHFNQMVTDLKGLIEKIQHAADAVFDSSEHITDMSEDAFKRTEDVLLHVSEITQGAKEQAADASEGATRMEEISCAIQDINDYAVVIMNTAKDMEQVITHGAEQVLIVSDKSTESFEMIHEVHQQVNQLNQELKYIEGIADTINNISRQTDLLALNAAIEAARAGEAGRGFSVVADEIRKLALQVSSNTLEISHSLNQVESRAKGVEQVVNISQTIAKQQNVAVKDTQEAFKTITQAMHEMVRKVTNITCSIEEINQEKQGVVDVVNHICEIADHVAYSAGIAAGTSNDQYQKVEHIRDYANDLTSLASDLEQHIGHFKLKKI